MQNQVIIIDKEELKAAAANYFNKMCGFSAGSNDDDKGTKRQRMMAEAMSIHEGLFDDISVTAVVRSFQSNNLNKDAITLEGITLSCKALEQISQDSVTAIYAYVLTIGDMPFGDDDDLMGQFYGYAWGTAYVDAGRDRLREIIHSFGGDPELILTESFGPGYYGMDTAEIHNLFKIIDGSKIGVNLRESGLMLPEKSCTGVFLLLKAGSKLPEAPCLTCTGKGCGFCSIYNKELVVQ